MNEKYAKNLRRQAEVMASQMIQHGRTVSTETIHHQQSPLSATLVNRTDTLRGIYRYLKKNDKQK